MYTAQWNDDIHHSLHTLVTGEGDGYYGDYAGSGARHLARCLAEGFAYQGEPSPYRDNRLRGESSAHLPPTAFVSFLQNHDQVGNRALGERIDRKSTRLNSSHVAISYAVFCLKKKKKEQTNIIK